MRIRMIHKTYVGWDSPALALLHRERAVHAQSGFGADTATIAVVGGLGLVALILFLMGPLAGYYVGKRFNRPWLGALGGIFGAPGIGVAAAFPGPGVKKPWKIP